MNNERKDTCKECEKEYSQAEVARTLGKFSQPYMLGYCSAGCYTKAYVKRNIGRH